jgi:hypothetical protein
VEGRTLGEGRRPAGGQNPGEPAAGSLQKRTATRPRHGGPSLIPRLARTAFNWVFVSGPIIGTGSTELRTLQQ